MKYDLSIVIISEVDNMTEIELAYCKQEESYLNEVYLYMIPNNRRRMLGFPVLRRRLIIKIV